MIQEGNEQALGKWQRRRFSHVGLVTVSFMLVAVLAQVVMMFSVEMVDMLPGGAMDFFSGRGLVLMSAIPIYLVAFPVSVVLIQLVPKCGGSQRQRWGTEKFTACLVIAAGMGLVGNLLGQLVEWFKPSGLGDGELDRILMNSGIWMTILFTVVVVPVIEELLFRKLLMDRLLEFEEGLVILVPGLMFGIVHGNLSQFFYAFGIGLLRAYVCAKMRKVSYTITLHMIFNFLGGAISVELSKGVKGLMDLPWFLRKMEHLLDLDFSGIISALSELLITGYLLFTVACLVGGIAILILYRKEIRFAPGIWSIQRGKRFRTVFLNPGVIIYFLICIGLLVLNWQHGIALRSLHLLYSDGRFAVVKLWQTVVTDMWDIK